MLHDKSHQKRGGLRPAPIIGWKLQFRPLLTWKQPKPQQSRRETLAKSRTLHSITGYYPAWRWKCCLCGVFIGRLCLLCNGNAEPCANYRNLQIPTARGHTPIEEHHTCKARTGLLPVYQRAVLSSFPFLLSQPPPAEAGRNSAEQERFLVTFCRSGQKVTRPQAKPDKHQKNTRKPTSPAMASLTPPSQTNHKYNPIIPLHTSQ